MTDDSLVSFTWSYEEPDEALAAALDSISDDRPPLPAPDEPPESSDEDTSVELLPDFGAAAAGLPPIPSYRHDVFRFYQFEFAPDATTCKRTADGLTPHPIYPGYVLDAYALQHSHGGGDEYLDAIARVADRAIAQMEPVPGYPDTLAAYFSPDDGLTAFPGRFYSGLVQVRYARSLAKAATLLDRADLMDVANRVFNSLTVPVEVGGVLLQTPFGPCLEEYPHSIPTYVLNGWTTAILELFQYAQESGQQAARDLAIENLHAVEQLVPRYDLPHLLNSRYQLTGYAYLKVVVDHPRSIRLTEFSTEVAGTRHGLAPDESSRWYNFVRGREVADDGFVVHRQLMLNGVFSLIEDVQRLRMTVHCRRDTTLHLSLAQGDYDPLLTAMPTQTWQPLGEMSLKRGINTLEIEVDNAAIDKVVYPTNFRKLIAGAYYNAYHYVHVQNFEEIQHHHKSKVLAKTARRWRRYTAGWAERPELQHEDIRIESIRSLYPATPKPFSLRRTLSRWARRLTRRSS